jgi:hypothetical protein
MVGEKDFYHGLLFSVEALVFGLLAIFFLLYSRGVGRQYVTY